MDNQKSGYIPLYRSILKQPWAKDVYLRTLWENLLLGAARKPFTASFKGHEWHLQPGQLVVTATDLSLQLCDRKGNPASRDQVERMLQVFVREEMISIDGEKQKGRVITITNYAEYAQKMGNLPAHGAAHDGTHGAAHDEASNGAGLKVVAAHDAAHMSAQTTAQHEQEGNNKNKNIKRSTFRNSEESRNDATDKFLSRHPEAADGIYTPSGKSWGTADDLKAARWIYSQLLTVNASLSEPKWVEWANTIRLMRVQDHRTHYEICDLLKWASKDDFWDGNILSPSSLRKHWDTLTTQRARKPKNSRTSAAPLDFDNTDWAEGLLP
ncbi:replication protein [Atlantibacter hermannii]|uniref:replication protein n=1 Tax=Atlantibacter hermannii TaxID=565 RepID=UPI0028A78168|nr:replication protein [Atlantibacter hermannii]